MYQVQKRRNAEWRDFLPPYQTLEAAEWGCQYWDNRIPGRIVDHTGKVVWEDSGVPPRPVQAVAASDGSGQLVGYQTK